MRSEPDFAESLTEYDRTDFWVERIAQLDEILERPAKTLVQLVQEALKNASDHSASFTVATHLRSDSPSGPGGSLLIHAVACPVVQRLYNEKRRFPWLDEKTLKQLRTDIPEALVQHPALACTDDLEEFVKCVSDPAFGPLSPIVAAEIFWVLIRAGEAYAHGDLGFFAMFTLLWSLKRRPHESLDAGAALGRWRPTIAVTARSLLPILTLQETLRTRASLYKETIDAIKVIGANEEGRNQYERWTFALTLDQLANSLHELARISNNPRDFHTAANAITGVASTIDPRTHTLPKAHRVRVELSAVLRELGRQNKIILAKARRQ